MKAPVAASMRQGNHGPQARSICKKISPQHAQTGKHEYFLKAEIHGRSKPWEFFTDDLRQAPQNSDLLERRTLHQSVNASGRATASSGLRSAATPQTAATAAATIIRAEPRR